MRKIDSSLIVCTAEQSQALIGLGILPASVFCYEWILDEEVKPPPHLLAHHWSFAGEYMGQDNVLPAWCMEELHVLIGGDFVKPDLFAKREWTSPAINMMQWAMFLPKKRKNFFSGAEASAAFLEFLLRSKEITAAEANARLDAFITKKFFNPMNDTLKKKDS